MIEFLNLRLLLVISFFVPSQLPADNIVSAEISFYSEQLSLSYNEEILFKKQFNPKIYNSLTGKSQLQEFYEHLNSKDYHGLLQQLEDLRKSFALNDWLFYDLMQKSINVIFRDYSPNHRTLINWFLLSKTGFDVRITYFEKQLFLNAYTTEELFEVPIFQDSGKSFVNLTSFHSKDSDKDMLYVATFIPQPNGRSFSFNLETLPGLSPDPVEKIVQFQTESHLYEFKVKIDQTLINMMSNYPFIAEYKYLEIPPSESLLSSIIPPLKEILAEKNWKETLEILVSFTRTGFNYKTDEEVYGKSKPMITEEIFHYTFSDCEDRSALFYTLVKSLLNYSMIVIAYPDHITVAVATPEPIGKPVFFEGKNYYICDPTGPLGSYEIGDFPEGYENKDYTVITSYSGRN